MDQQMCYFISVVDEHNFTRAAKKCNISQSAISQQIKELENNIGTLLLTHKGCSFELTPAGQFFYQHAKKIVNEIDELITDIRKISKEEADEHVLRIGYLTNFGTDEFLQAVTHFSKKYSQVKVKIKSGLHEDLFKILNDEQPDLAFSDQRKALSNEYQNEFLTATDFMAVVPKEQFTNYRRKTKKREYTKWNSKKCTGIL